MKNILDTAKYAYALCKIRQAEGHLSAARQIIEILTLQMIKGIGYSKYHFAEMWKKDASLDYKFSFLSHRNFVNKIHQINSRKFHGLTQFKPNEKAFFKLFHIPCAEYIGTLNQNWGVACNGAKLQTKEELTAILKPYLDQDICFKILEGSGGKDFRIYRVNLDDRELTVCHANESKKHSIAQLYEDLLRVSPDGWLIEKAIAQHSLLAKLNPSSVNTIRMYVFQDNMGKMDILGSFLRIGRKNSLTDNSASGGLVCKITPEKGKLQQACEWSPSLHGVSAHPDHRAQIEGITIPFWNEAKTLGLNTLALLPKTRFAGFDIAITQEGPIMVEVNIQPDSDGLSYMKIQTANVFDG